MSEELKKEGETISLKKTHFIEFIIYIHTFK